MQVRVVVGKSVTFRCRVFGAPRPALSWQRDDSSTALTTGVAKDGFNTTFTIEVCYMRSLCAILLVQLLTVEVSHLLLSACVLLI